VIFLRFASEGMEGSFNQSEVFVNCKIPRELMGQLRVMQTANRSGRCKARTVFKLQAAFRFRSFVHLPPFESCSIQKRPGFETQEFFLLKLGILPIAVKNVKVHIVAPLERLEAEQFHEVAPECPVRGHNIA
jgi:hypothetical protein